MAFRLCDLPLTKENFNDELDHIRKVASLNGFNPALIDEMVTKLKRKKQVREMTTLLREKESCKRKSFIFNPVFTNKMKNKFKQHGIETVFRSECKLKNLLGSTKDKRNSTDKCGIYRAVCEICGVNYIGKSIRAVKERISKHMRYIKNRAIDETAFTEHVVMEKHFASKANFELIEEVYDLQKIDLLESYHIYSNKDCVVNKDDGNAYSPLFELLETKRDATMMYPKYSHYA